MTTAQFLADTLTRNFEMLNTTLSDFSDSDLLVRPVPNANHAAWQLTHLINSETGMLRTAGAVMPVLPQSFLQRSLDKNHVSDDPALFPTKAELLDLYSTVRAATIAHVRTLSDADLEQPTPDESMRPFFPTVAALIEAQSDHLTTHLGQMQVIRRKLNKKLLF